MEIKLSHNNQIPYIINDINVLIPISISIKSNGLTLIDNFCWNINSFITPYEYSCKYCCDMNLPTIFITKMSLMISEQIVAYQSILRSIKSIYNSDIKELLNKINESFVINISIRYNLIEYNDKVLWNINNNKLTPEPFAKVTCSDLGLPSEIEPIISFQIREAIFKRYIIWLDDFNEYNKLYQSIDNKSFTSDVKVELVPSSSAVDTITSCYKINKPNSIDDQLIILQTNLPANKDTNAYIWSNVKEV